MTALILIGAISKFLNKRLDLKLKTTHHINSKTHNKLDYGTAKRNDQANKALFR